MTEAQKAHLRLLENTPLEKIRTHVCKDRPQIGERPSPEVTMYRRRFIRQNIKTMTQKEMARALDMTQGAVSWQVQSMGLEGPGRGRPKKGKNG